MPAVLQSALIRLGFDPGRINGVMKPRTLGAIRDAGIDLDGPMVSAAVALKARCPEEY